MLLNICLPGLYNLIEKKNAKTAITTQWDKNNTKNMLSTMAIAAASSILERQESRWLELSWPLKDGQEFTLWQRRDEPEFQMRESMWKNKDMKEYVFS